jgi:hypothetical protein
VAGVVRFAESISDEGRPVAVAPEHRQIDSAAGQFGLHGRLERPVLRVDRADAAVGAVVVGHLFEPLIGDAAPARDIAQERDDVFLALGAAEGRQDDGIIVLRRHPAVFVHARARIEVCFSGGHRSTSAISAGLMRRPV